MELEPEIALVVVEGMDEVDVDVAVVLRVREVDEVELLELKNPNK